MTTTTATTTTAADPHAMIWAENARIHDLRRAMYAWRADPVGGSTCLVKDITRKHCASDHEITRVYLRVSAGRVSAGLRPNALAYQDLDAYAAAWRDALVKELRAYKATSDHCFSVVLQRRFDEARFLRLNGGKAAKTHHKARAHRAWRRNAERMARNWALSL
jgi:hypothetical protein